MIPGLAIWNAALSRLVMEELMPKQYEAIKADAKKRGKSDREAKRIAAATYNKDAKKKGKAPVTRNYEKTKAKKAAATRKRKK